MQIQQSLKQSSESFWVTPFVSSIIITLYLFYIDEGFYNFNWMKHFGGWIVFSFYVSIFTILQYILGLLLIRIVGIRRFLNDLSSPHFTLIGLFIGMFLCVLLIINGIQ